MNKKPVTKSDQYITSAERNIPTNPEAAQAYALIALTETTKALVSSMGDMQKEINQASEVAEDVSKALSPVIEVGDIIQISPLAKGIDPCWRSVFALVEEVISWGVMAFSMAPEAGVLEQPPGRFYIRLAYFDENGRKNFDKVGTSLYIPGDVAQKMFPEAHIDPDDFSPYRNE